MTFKAGDYVATYIRAAHAIYYGKINLVTKEGIYVEIAKDIFYHVEPALVVILPMRLVHKARVAVEAGLQIKRALTMVTSAPILVASAAAPGLAGGAATMSGLAGIGATVGAGAVGGIIIIAAAPAVLGTAALAGLVHGLGADRTTTAVVAGTGIITAGASTLSVIAAVSEGGAVAGLSGSGITSGLAALGGGALSAGGGGMAGGLVMCAAVPLACTAVGVGVAMAGMQTYKEITYQNRLKAWKNDGGDFPFTPRGG